MAPDAAAHPRCIIDVEASGFGRGSYPIEVGMALPDGSTYCSLITPEPDWLHWDSGAQQVHGIERQTLLAHGRPARAVADELNRRLHGMTVYCDAWYHDYQWLARLFDAAQAPQCFTLRDLRQLLDEAAQARWQGTRERVLQELQLRRHRASNDARVLQLTLMRLLAPAQDPGPIH